LTVSAKQFVRCLSKQLPVAVTASDALDKLEKGAP
jgi:hypothetical protein